MTLSRLNLATAVVSCSAGCLWLALGEGLSGLVWLVCSLVWLTLSITHRGATIREPHPVKRLARRFSRLLLWS